MAKTPKGHVVITGASTGIGHACARIMAKAGYHVFAGVRKDADAERLTAELGEAVTPLIIDVTKPDQIKAAADTVRETLHGRTLAGLVNNAGIAVTGPLTLIDPEEVDWQFQVNVMGPLRVTQAFAPLLGTDDSLEGKPGAIVQMSSVAGKMGMPFVGPYAASKHALEGMSKSLRRELGLYGIRVVLIGPGAVATPIWDKADEGDMEPYKDTEFAPAMRRVFDWMKDRGPKGLKPETIARKVKHAIVSSNPGNRYALVPQRLTNWTIPRLLPEKIVDKMVAKQLGLRPEDRKKS